MCFGGILGFIDLLCVASGFLSPPHLFLSSPFSFLLCCLPKWGKKKKEWKKRKKERKKEKELFLGQKDEKDSLPT